MKYEVKNVKLFEGMEGYGFNCSLYCDGKRVAKVIDDASGGEIMFYFDKDEDEKKLFEFVKTLPKIPFKFSKSDKEFMDVNRDMFVAGLVDTFEKRRKLRRYCKDAVLFRIKGDDEDAYRTIPLGKGGTLLPPLVHLRNKYPTQIQEVIYIEDKQLQIVGAEAWNER